MNTRIMSIIIEREDANDERVNVSEELVGTQSKLEYIRCEILASNGHEETRVRALELSLARVQMRRIDQRSTLS